jgi:hypothetical protein
MAVAVLVCAFVQHARTGIDVTLMAYVVASFGLAFAALLALRERLEPPPTMLVLLACAGVAGLAAPSFAGSWFVAPAATLLALSRYCGTAESPDASGAEELPALGLGLGASAVAWFRWQGDAIDYGVAFFAAIVAYEAWGPGAPRSVRAASARTCALSIFAAAALVRGFSEVPLAGMKSEAIYCVGLAVLAAWCFVDSVARGFHGSTSAELPLRRRRILVAMAPLFLFWVGGELLFRIVPNRHRDVTIGHAEESDQGEPNTWHKPGGVYVYYGAPLLPREPGATGVKIRWNKEGFNDVDHEIAKPAKRARIAVLGDSYVEAVQVKPEENYSRLLERELARATPRPVMVEVLAFAASGWGQDAELEALKSRAAPYGPDLVLVEFLCGNDVRNNLAELEDLVNSGERSFARTSQVWALQHGLYFSAFVAERVHRVYVRAANRPSGIDGGVYDGSPPQPELWARAWQRTDELVGQLDAECERLRARLVVVVFTSPDEIAHALDKGPLAPGYDFRRPTHRMEEICRKRSIACLALPTRFAMRGGPELKRLHGVYDGHWVSLGHRWAAEETAKFLVEDTTILKEVLEKVR